MPIYEKSTKELIHEFAAQSLKPGQVFSPADAVRWFSAHYPRIKSNTVAMHINGMSIRSPRRRHAPHIRPGTGWDLFFRLSPHEFRLWDPETDPTPWYKADFDADVADSGGTTDEGAEEDARNDHPRSRTFAFEKDLQNYLVRNLERLEPGLKLYEEEDGGFTGVEFPAGSRYIDILAVDNDGAYVVIETKVSRAYDRVVGQVLRYMGWIREHLAGEAPVKGIIVASEISKDLILATSCVKDIRLVEYEISFSLKPVGA